MKDDHHVLFPLNPARLASYRKAFTTSGVKNDRGDAELLLKYLLEHFDCLWPWLPDDSMTRTGWVRAIFRCWKNRTPYNEATYLASLPKRYAPILQLLTT